ncbi:MAG: PHP-associated domain-containing protein [Thermodesulfobacteriota bacterium]
MLIDMHIHTSRYSLCSLIDPYEMVVAAVERGLDGVVITEHNRFWGMGELKELRARAGGLLVLGGAEITGLGGGHLLAYGVGERHAGLVVEEGVDEGSFMEKVRALGGVVVSAHPYRYGPGLEAGLAALPPDGVEVKSINVDDAGMEKARALAKMCGIFEVAGSDAHTVEYVGAYCTEFYGRIRSEEELVSALKKGEFRPIVNRYTDL